METFIEPKQLVPDERFDNRRTRALKKLDFSLIDPPIVDVIKTFATIPYCFTLQCCWGHFVYPGQPDPNSCEPLGDIGGEETVHYRIAYVAFCLKNSTDGKALYDDLRSIVRLDPANVQFGTGEWFWRQHVNSYALQVEPERFKTRDTAEVRAEEALHLEWLKAKMWEALKRIATTHSGRG